MGLVTESMIVQREHDSVLKLSLSSGSVHHRLNGKDGQSLKTKSLYQSRQTDKDSFKISSCSAFRPAVASCLNTYTDESLVVDAIALRVALKLI